MVFFGLPKNLVNFFTDFEIPQIVFLKLLSPDEEFTEDTIPVQQFICNSVILAIHSEKFRKIICNGSVEIYLYRTCDTDTVRNCIEFMYGNRSIVRHADDIISMLKFADVWDIPSLWLACLEQIKAELSDDANKIFEFYSLYDDIASKDWQQDLLSRELNKTSRKHADSLIQHLIGQPCLLGGIDHQILESLIKSSKTAACGKLVTLLLGSRDKHLMNLVLMNLQAIPAATAFENESEFLSFKSQLSASDRCKLVPITIEFYRHHSTESAPLVADSLSLDVSSGLDKQENMLGVTIEEPFITDLPNMKVIDGFTQPNNVDIKISWNTLRVEKIRKQLFATEISCRSRIPLSGYPGLIKKNFSLYTGLDIIAHFISQSQCLNQLNLINLLLPYFENPLIPESVLQDVKVIALRKCSQKSMIQTVDSDLQAGFVPNRIDTFAVEKTFKDVRLFEAKLGEEKMIDLKLDDCILCPIFAVIQENRVVKFIH